MEADFEDIPSEIVADLDNRTSQLEFYLTGALELGDVPSDEASVKPGIYTRIKAIEGNIKKLAAQRKDVGDMLRLCLSTLGFHILMLTTKDSEFSELFPSDGIIPSSIPDEDEKDASKAPPEEQLNVVNACTTMYPSLVSRLNLLNDLKIPPPEATAALLAVKPRLTRAEVVQNSLAEDIAQLRLRSILLTQRWMKVGIIAAGHCWADWEERLMEVEKIVCRVEFAKGQEQQP